MNFIIFCLNKNYTFYINYIKNIQDHIYDLLKNYVITNNDKNIYINNLYETQRKINFRFEDLYDKNINIQYDINKFKNINKNINKLNNEQVFNLIGDYTKIKNPLISQRVFYFNFTSFNHKVNF